MRASPELIRELFDYDPERGVVTRRISINSKFKKGDVVGTKNSHGHLICRVNYRIWYVHRLIWMHVYGEEPTKMIDHINGDRSDNRLSNLRLANHSENAHNKRVVSSSGMKGAHYSKSERKWRSSIKKHGKSIHLGWFRTKEEAAAAYQKVAVQHYGEFARF